MYKLNVFNAISLDGFFVDERGDMSWAHQGEPDAQWDAFVEGNARGGSILLLGRVTYEMMATFWSTPAAAQRDPVVAKQMNNLKK